MMETWHPLGVCGVISAFNFPVAVWSWNAALALVCGDPVVWKPSEKTPLTALAVASHRASAPWRGSATRPQGLSEVLIGGRDVGEMLVDDPPRALSSAPPARPRWAAPSAPRLAARFAPRHPGARRQQRRDRHPVGRSRSGAARHRLRRHGHGRPALHDAAPPVRRTRASTTQLRAAAVARSTRPFRSAIRAARTPWSVR